MITALFTALFALNLSGQSGVSSAQPREAGTCQTAEGGYISISSTLRIENSRAEIKFDSSRYVAEINGETIRITDEDSGIVVFIRVDTKIDVNEDLDLDLKFVLLEGELSLYWRETFRHRLYRQGIFRILRDGLAARCSGVGGIES